MDWKAYNQQEEDERLVNLIVAYGRAFPARDTRGLELLPTAPGKIVHPCFQHVRGVMGWLNW